MPEQMVQLSLGDDLDFRLTPEKNVVKNTVHYQWCYVCDQFVDGTCFTNANDEVCQACRQSVAYTTLMYVEHGSKWCSQCQHRQPVTEFLVMANGLLTPLCKVHEREQRIKEEANRQTRDGRRLTWYRRVKSHLACTMCGNTQKLWFVHLNQRQKDFELADGVQQFGIDELKHEMRKCEPMCESCARMFTSSNMYKNGLSRQESKYDWDRVFALADKEQE